MHAVLITFVTSASLDDLEDPFRDYAMGLRSVQGLVSKTWIRNGETLGGFHVFTREKDAERYLSSDMVAGLTSNPAFSDFEISHFDVLEEFSRITGTPSVAIAG